MHLNVCILTNRRARGRNYLHNYIGSFTIFVIIFMQTRTTIKRLNIWLTYPQFIALLIARTDRCFHFALSVGFFFRYPFLWSYLLLFLIIRVPQHLLIIIFLPLLFMIIVNNRFFLLCIQVRCSVFIMFSILCCLKKQVS